MALVQTVLCGCDECTITGRHALRIARGMRDALTSFIESAWHGPCVMVARSGSVSPSQGVAIGKCLSPVRGALAVSLCCFFAHPEEE